VLIPLYPEKCLKMPQNPQRPVHALLGNLPTRTMAEKRHHRKHDKILHATLIFTRTKKTVTYKTLAEKNGPDRTKPQTNLSANFGNLTNNRNAIALH
jgi:uncharacterized Zn-finger protein